MGNMGNIIPGKSQISWTVWSQNSIYRQTERQTDRQTTDRQNDSLTDRQIDKQTERQTDRYRQRDTDRQTETDLHIYVSIRQADRLRFKIK